ncbi:MAG: hypothetical protein NTV52_20830 [Acidobacteria bacterium]|nr:hypothetical protein [Acidobacteriota bacterium]
MFRLLFVLGAGAVGALAQVPAAGLPPEWETRKQLSAMVANANRLDPILAQLHPEAWKEAGAPDAYVQQLQSTRRALQFLQVSADRLSKDPNRVTYAMDTYFRLQTMEQMLGSLATGVRRYQNPAIGDLLSGIANENAANREFLEQYLKDLAAVREAEIQIADAEAQRCRGILSKQPPVIQKRSVTPPKQEKQ